MKTLVILLAAKGTPMFENAADVFKELFDKVRPDRVKALRTDSEFTLPDGLEEAAGCECSAVVVPPIDDQMPFDPKTYWSEYLIELFREIGIDADGEELHFHISGAGYRLSTLVRAAAIILGGQLWITSQQGGSWTAHEVTTRGGGSGKEPATMAALAETWIVGETMATAKRLQSVSNSIPDPKGIENSLRSAIEDGLVVTGGGGDSVTYCMTDRGALHGLIELASRSKDRPPEGAHEGILLLVRATWSKEDLEGYLKEHGLVGRYTKVGLIAVEFFEDDGSLSGKSSEYEEAVLEFKSPDDLVAVESVSGVLPSSKGDDLWRGGAELLKAIHSVVFSGSGKWINWSMPSTGIPAQLRNWVEEYAARGSIRIFEVTKRVPDIGPSGRDVSPSGLDARYNIVLLPLMESLVTMRAIRGDQRIYTRPALATLFMSEIMDMGPVKRTPLDESYCQRNFDIFAQGHHLREKKNESGRNRRAFEHLVKLGAIHPGRDQFDLTPEGRVAAFVLSRGLVN